MDSMGECLPWLRTIFLNWSLFLRSNLCDTVMAWLYPPPSDPWGSAGPSVRPSGEHSVTHPLAPACRPLPLICSFCLLTPDSVRAESLNFFTGLCRTSGSLCTFGRPGRAGRCLRPLCQANFSFRAGPCWCADRGYWQPPRDQEVHRALNPLFCLHGFTEAPGHRLKERWSGQMSLCLCPLPFLFLLFNSCRLPYVTCWLLSTPAFSSDLVHKMDLDRWRNFLSIKIAFQNESFSADPEVLL